jgi:membrane associated rhomboid family serine protease
LSDSVLQPQTGAYVGNTVFRTLAFYDPIHRDDPTWLETRNALVDIGRGQVWRLATPAFLHLGLGHLIFNMIMLYSLGGLIESRQDKLRMAILFLLCATAGNVGQYALSGGTSVGMSGVVYGLFGYLCVYRLLAPQHGLGVRNETIIILLVWLVLGFTGVLADLLGAPVANWAHLFGMLMGMLIAFVAIATTRRDGHLQKKRPLTAD